MLDITKEYAFLSYSHKDNIDPLIKWFDEHGYNIVYDKTIYPGDIWDMKVRKYINNPMCKGVISLISQNFLSSPSILKETDYIHRFNRKYLSISLDNQPPLESFKLIKNEDDKEIASFIMESFPVEKIYLNLRDVLNENDDRLEHTLEEWGIYHEIINPDYSSIKDYTAEFEGTKERLARLREQQKSYYDFDMKVINKLLEDKGDIVVLDLGCSNGELAFSRFSDECYKTVIGVDINEQDIRLASNANYGDKFHFFNYDLESEDFIKNIKNELDKLGIKKVDFIFMALVLHHLKNPEEILTSLRELLNEDGKIFIRGSDDGGKLCYPGNDLMFELFTRYNELIKSTNDRQNGRKLFHQLYQAGFKDIKLHYSVFDTCECSKEEKMSYFKIGFNFRKLRLEEIKRLNPDNIAIQNEVAWQLEAINKIKEMFLKDDFWYSNVLYIATASVK